MRGYTDIPRSTSHCVVFIDEGEIDPEDVELVQQVREQGYRIAYIDCATYEDRHWEIPSHIGAQIATHHPPYHEGREANLARWLDDLIALAYSTPGLIIVLDNAFVLWNSQRKFMSELMEAYLIQVHHWLEQKVPCHLCFQMVPSPLVRQWFATSAA
ncbi:hypothetical protein HLB44_36460 [Aquincola sp. S2]|uniref:Barstar (barnase inhibitor) domain-containing protein n=1 Tax=Pseudaquabacterium terrae TaxID=2732868 RepID=A0ABX2EVH0_9BURK|nr:hypothetical protein [Aquabacterium terrae]NRF72457.1 hypothetical protein [Aquabacterium terrae]